MPMAAPRRPGAGIKRAGLVTIAGALVLGTLTFVYMLAWNKAESDTRDVGTRHVRSMARDIDSMLEKFEVLPYTLAMHPAALHVLHNPNSAAAAADLNAILRRVQLQANAAAIYLMDRGGATLAASNWDLPQSFVGRNFSFRPYFIDAMKGRTGYFYGIGNKTGEPGYFIAYPVYDAQGEDYEPVGVIVVKISLDEIEDTWRSIPEPMALTDSEGVIFLSNRDIWRYRSLQPLQQGIQQSLASTLQYAGKEVHPVKDANSRSGPDLDSAVLHRVGPLHWQLMLFPDMSRVRATAMYVTVATALLLLAGGLAWWAGYQRKRRIRESLASKRALRRAASELEHRIAERTAELTSTNLDLERKLSELQRTESTLRATQDELVQAGKLAILGQMAAGMTHELNQPVTAIRAFADNGATFLARGMQERATENFQHIGNACSRMGAIIKQLKGFARKSGDTLVRVDLGETIQTSVRLLESDFRRAGVPLVIRMEQTVTVLGDPVRVEQVLVNLLRNALDACEHQEESMVVLTLEGHGQDAVIRVSDTGSGIAEHIASRLFEPFFTTKEAGRGLGLGLAISSSIVQAMCGQISATNRPEGGAEFIVKLPMAAALPGAETMERNDSN